MKRNLIKRVEIGEDNSLVMALNYWISMLPDLHLISMKPIVS